MKMMSKSFPFVLRMVLTTYMSTCPKEESLVFGSGTLTEKDTVESTHASPTTVLDSTPRISKWLSKVNDSLRFTRL